MSARTASRATLAALSLALGACQRPDVGDPCHLDVSAGSPPAPIDYDVQAGVACSADAADYFRSGAIDECDNAICIRSATSAACSSPSAPAAFTKDVRKYCSKPCVSDRDCQNDTLTLVCRPVVFDSCFLSFLQWCSGPRSSPNPCPSYPSTSCPADAAFLLGSIPSSNYCATPPR